jgi:hypothetical protein
MTNMGRSRAAELLGQSSHVSSVDMLERLVLQNWPVEIEGQTLPFNTLK